MNDELNLVRQLSDEGKTSELLFLAVARGRLSSISQILANEPELLHSTDHRGATPLHKACEAGHVDVIRALLASGAPCTTLFRQATPLQLALDHNISSEPFQTALLQAVCAGDAERCLELVHGGVDPNSHHVLCWATDLGHHHVVEALIHVDADVNLARSSDGKTALHIALSNQNQDMVKILLAVETTNLSFKDTNGVTPKELAQTMGMSLSVLSSSDSLASTASTASTANAADNNDSNDSKEVNQTNDTKALQRKVTQLEHQLEEQKNLVSGLRDMLNIVLVENGVQKLVGTLQSELKRVKAESVLLAESSFRKLKATRDEKIDRMCSSSIEHTSHSEETQELEEEISTFGYVMSILGLQDDDESEEEEF
jgi:ankyrin repeat protein